MVTISYVIYATNDYLDTPHMLTDESNTVVWEALYKPFGEDEVNPNSTIVNNIRFPGQYYDAETGFHYNYFRYYNPSTGRYLRPDPIGLAGMDPNLYGYVLNNPVNFVDPYGLIRWGQVGTGVASLVGGGITLVTGGVVTAIGIGEFGTIPVSGPVGFLMGIHTVGVGGTLMITGGGLAWFGLTNAWDGLFNDSGDPCEDFGQSVPKVIPYSIPTRSNQPTDTIVLRSQKIGK